MELCLNVKKNGQGDQKRNSVDSIAAIQRRGTLWVVICGRHSMSANKIAKGLHFTLLKSFFFIKGDAEICVSSLLLKLCLVVYNSFWWPMFSLKKLALTPHLFQVLAKSDTYGLRTLEQIILDSGQVSTTGNKTVQEKSSFCPLGRNY